MPIFKADAQGAIKSVTSISMLRPDGVIRSASSAWRLDDAGVIRKVFTGGGITPPPPIPRLLLFDAGTWNPIATVTTRQEFAGIAEVSGGKYVLQAMASSGQFPYSGVAAQINPVSGNLYTMLQPYKTLCVDLDISVNGASANPLVSIYVGDFGQTSDTQTDMGQISRDIVRISLSGLTEATCGSSIVVSAYAPFGSDIYAYIYKMWLE